MRRLTLLGVLVALLLGTTSCMPSFGHKMHITAYLPDSAGLFVGNDVGILGVPVGTVTAIKPQGTRVKVTLELDGDQAVPANAVAAVVARSVATDRYVELTPVYKSGPKMTDGGVIEPRNTRTPVDFDDVLAALNTFATGISGSGETKDAIKRLLAAGNGALQGHGQEFNRAITALGGAVDSISAQRGNITGSVKALDVLTGTIAANQQLVRQFTDQVSQAAALLAEERTNFGTALTSLSTAVQLVADFAHQNRQQLVTSLNRSSTLMSSLLTKRAQLEETLRVMPVTLQNLRNSLVGDRVQVRVDPTVLLPVGGLIDQLCKAGKIDNCAALGPSLLNLKNLLALLGLG
ncbi:MAG: MCE family protein [Nocardioidaceae bacterium]|nr:MCE family protein [Nocardioidaceae bacterium]